MPRRLLTRLAAAITAASISVMPALAATMTVVVTETNMQGWTESSSPPATDVTFVDGPDTPPLGTGSAQFDIAPGAGASAAQLRNPDYAGTLLSDLTELGYSTYVTDNLDSQAVYIILQVDYDENGTVDDLLFFEPVYQGSTFCTGNPQADVTLATWQTWDALNGCWWSLNSTAGATPGTGVKPLADIITAEPDAVIVNSVSGAGGVRLVAGFGAGAWDDFHGNADAFTIGILDESVTYDFELHSLPADTDACKNGGWQTFNPPDGPFKNQGQCVSFVQTGQ